MKLPPHGEVHFWLLPREESLLDKLATAAGDLLSHDEGVRERSFQSPVSRRRFLLQRYLLRRGLSYYLDRNPEQLAFIVGRNGKPVLAQPPASEFCFNLSHSGATAVLAVAGKGRLGIDLEPLTRAETTLKISKRFFSDAERQWLDNNGESTGRDSLGLWVLKESVVKAMGESVWDGLAKVQLHLGRQGISWLVSPPSDNEQDWALSLFELQGSHLMATALNAPAVQHVRPQYRLYSLASGEQIDASPVKPLLRAGLSRDAPVLL